MKDPFENWGYGDWANLKLFDDQGVIVTPYPDLNEPKMVSTVTPIEAEKEESR